MYSDDYITEGKFTLNGKEYASKKAAESELKRKGLSYSEVQDAIKKGKFAGEKFSIGDRLGRGRADSGYKPTDPRKAVKNPSKVFTDDDGNEHTYTVMKSCIRI